MAKETTSAVAEKTVKQYAIVAKSDMNLLVEEVNHLLQRGWQPLGGQRQKELHHRGRRRKSRHRHGKVGRPR